MTVAVLMSVCHLREQLLPASNTPSTFLFEIMVMPAFAEPLTLAPAMAHTPGGEGEK